MVDLIIENDYESHKDICFNDNKIEQINSDLGLTLSYKEIEYIKQNYKSWNNPLFIIYDIAQSNSEHCRHHFFNGNFSVSS